MSLLQNRSQIGITQLRNRLQAIIENDPAGLQGHVADEALHYGDDPMQMFADLSKCGCQTGTIRNLIGYADTTSFFDRHYHEIEELREEY